MKTQLELNAWDSLQLAMAGVLVAFCKDKPEFNQIVDCIERCAAILDERARVQTCEHEDRIDTALLLINNPGDMPDSMALDAVKTILADCPAANDPEFS